MSLLVTGATGYLGRELLHRTEAVGISSRDADIRDAAAVATLFERLRPEAAINTAYRHDDRATTFDGAAHVAAAAATTPQFVRLREICSRNGRTARAVACCSADTTSGWNAFS